MKIKVKKQLRISDLFSILEEKTRKDTAYGKEFKVWRLYIGMACDSQTVAAHLVGHDEQDVEPVLL